MKTIQKASMKKKIISALFSLVAFCAVIVIIIVSRNTSVSAAKDDVIIGGKLIVQRILWLFWRLCRINHLIY